jgi:putative flippase GtrA
MDRQEGQARHSQVIRQFVRFNVIGLVNTGVAYLLYAGLLYLDVHRQIALAADYALGLVLGFYLNRRFTFARGAEKGSVKREFGKMMLTFIPIYLLNGALLEAATQWGAINLYVSQIAILAIIAVLSFVAQKIYVFAEKRGGK